MTFRNWRQIPGYEGLYEVSDAGEVKTVARVQTRSNGTKLTVRSIVRKPRRTSKGYLVVDLSAPGGCKTHTVHKLVALAFIGPRPEGMELRHLNGNPQDCRLCNLQYGTRLENAADRIAHGRQFRGEGSPMAKLTEAQVLAIRSANQPQAIIAKAYGVSQKLISLVRRRVIWRHV